MLRRCATYEQLYKAVSKALFKAHVQSTMKEEIMRDPLRFVNVDPAYTRTLLDQRAAGKKLALITNSDWVRSPPCLPWPRAMPSSYCPSPSSSPPRNGCDITSHLRE